jgi:hypothetical protein
MTFERCTGSGRTVERGTATCPTCGKPVKLLRRMDYPYSGARVKVPSHAPAVGVKGPEHG